MKDAAKEKRVELLFEVGCEEIPAGMLPKAEEELRANIEKLLTAEQILISVFPRAVHDLTWPRSMTWTGLDGARFIRPIRWIVAVLDGKLLKLSVAGIAAGSTTRGHRFLGSNAIHVSNFLDYEK